MMKDEIIRWFVYEPLKWERELGYARLDKYCVAQVHRDFGAGFRQCIKRPSQTVGDFQFCTQHANMVRKALEKGKI